MHWNEWLSELFRRFQALFARGERFDRDLEEEMGLHRDLRARDLRDDGASLEDARYAAQRRFGNTLQLREEIHQAWGWTWLDRLGLDLRYGSRRLRQSPGFTAVAALTLALGIGANTAIYSFMDALLLRSLPVPDPQSLVVLKWHMKNVTDGGRVGGRSVVHGMSGSTYDVAGLGRTGGIFPFPAFELIQKSSRPFSTLFAYYPARDLNVMVQGQAEIDQGEYVSGDYFRGLAVPPAAGRLITADDDRVGAESVAVVSFGFSRRHFSGPATAIGQTIRVNNLPFVVVGVTAPEFFGVDPAVSPDLYFPMHANVALEAAIAWGVKPAQYLDAHEYWIEIMARLRPGVSIVQAQSALAPMFYQWVESTATTELEGANLPELVLQEGAGGLDALRRRYSKPLYILLTLVGLILAIACANIANLLLARSSGRRREMALRLSIGARRPRLVQLLLAESILLALLGGALGLLFARWGIRFLTVLLANGQRNFDLHADLNWHVLAAAAALSLATGVLFGMAPALQSLRVDVVPALKEVRTSESQSRFRLSPSHALVVSQIGLSLLLVVGAGLFVRTLRNLQSVELGINRENLLLFELNPQQAGRRGPEINSFHDALQKQFGAVPGVRSVSLSHDALIADGESGTCVSLQGQRIDDPTRYLIVGPEFFSTMQVPVLLGRENDEHDQANSPPVVMVNEVFAEANFSRQNPLGHHLIFGCDSAARDMQIIGVMKNAHYGDLRNDIPPLIYVPYSQSPVPSNGMTYALRTAGDPLAYVKTISDIAHRVDARVPVTGIRTQAAAIDQAMGQEIMLAKLCAAFAILALVIASIGLYGAMSYKVARRTGEIGIRMALGAQRWGVVRMVLREVLALAVIGLVLGLPAAFAGSRLIKSFLFEMQPNDPMTFIVAAGTLLSAALLAGYAPARRASRIDPMVALRHE